MYDTQYNNHHKSILKNKKWITNIKNVNEMIKRQTEFKDMYLIDTFMFDRLNQGGRYADEVIGLSRG